MIFVTNINKTDGPARSNIEHCDKDRVVVFSLEMGAEQLCQRLVSMNSSVDSTALRSGKMTDSQWTNVQNSIEELNNKVKWKFN